MCRGAERLPPGAAVLAEPPPSAKPDAPRARPRLWTLDPQHHCPIVGTCLPLADLQRIAKRCHFASRPDDDFGLHVEAVSHARSRNPASEAIQRHLDARYRLALARFARLKSDAELRQEWLACVDRGEVAGPLWALCTHRLASAIYNDSIVLTGSDQSASSSDSVLVRTVDGRIKTRAQSQIGGSSQYIY